MATDAGKRAEDRGLIFKPEHLSVDPEVRKILKRVLKIKRDSLEYSVDFFTGFIRFEVPKDGAFQASDVLTICAELAQAGLGARAEVETWHVVTNAAEHLVDLRPAEFELQDEDLDEAPPVSRKSFIGMVRPSQGWLVLIVPSVIFWLGR